MKDEWQPIETAPRDGTLILGWDGEDITVVFYRNGWKLSATGGYIDDITWIPTHWMHLPKLPIMIRR